MCPHVFGNKIAELRKKHNMTQRELAIKLSMSAKAISKWETGRSLPDIALLPKIASTFAIGVDELIAESHQS